MLRTLALAIASLMPVLAIPTAIAGSATAQLSASVPTAIYGDVVTVSGTATGDATCSGGRPVELQWRASGAAAFAAVAQGTTGVDGAFSFEQSQPHTGSYRAVLPEVATCQETISNEVAVVVRALVEGSLASASAQVGTCVDASVGVLPPKPGQSVELQRRVDGAWSTVQTVPLNGDGLGRADACAGADDAARVRFRFRWQAQDALNDTGTSARLVLLVDRPTWIRRIDRVVGARAVSVSVFEEDAFWYRRADEVLRTPASNEKLLLAMAALDTLGPQYRISTSAAAEAFANGVVEGDLWLLGRGDPTLGRASLAALADELVEAGLERVTGSVMGDTRHFRRDWGAPGWNDVARDYVSRPTALSYEGNGVAAPERAAAAALTQQLRDNGVRVRGRPGAAGAPAALQDVAAVESGPLRALLAKTLRPSWNFGAEVLGKGLGAEVRGLPGTIAKGAAAIEAWAEARGAEVTSFDSSGLSYANRVTAAGMVGLLAQAEDEDWGNALRRALPAGGQGTLEHRLHDVRVRAKTGSLTDVSALSGWVWAEQPGTWVEFSILCSGMPKSVASGIEDQIVRILAAQAG